MDQHRLLDLIRKVGIAMMTTVENDGRLRSRPMATIEKTLEPGVFDGSLWFFSSQMSPKTVEVQEDSRVNLSYAEPARQQFVSITGTCELVRDRKKAKELWSPVYRAWFPRGLNDPDLSLLRVSIEQAEYWDEPSSAMVKIAGLVKAFVTGRRYQPGDHEKSA